METHHNMPNTKNNSWIIVSDLNKLSSPNEKYWLVKATEQNLITSINLFKIIILQIKSDW